MDDKNLMVWAIGISLMSLSAMSLVDIAIKNIDGAKQVMSLEKNNYETALSIK